MQILLWLLLLAVLAPVPAAAPPRPTGMLKVHVLGPPGQSVPRELAVRVRPTLQLKGNEENPWEVIASCPVRDGECVCEVPAGRVDLRFQGAAVMPVYKWGVFVVSGETEDLGRLELRRGAAISGWVRTNEEKVLTHSVVVSLVPQSVGSGMVGLYPKPLRTVTLEANSRPWGFFKLEDVLPGHYAVVASEPGRPDAGFGPIIIEGDRSFELPEPVWITPPLRLDVQVTPPLGPGETPWEVAVVPGPDARAREPLAQERNGRSVMSGHWTFENLPPANYFVSVRDARHTRWKTGKVRVGPHSASLSLQVPFVEVRGRVLGPAGPVATALTFYSEGAETPLRSDEQGWFKGYLPDEGSWNVRLSTLPGHQSLFLQEPVRAPKGRPKFDLLVRIPNTRLRVEVVDERGRSVPKAWLNVLGTIRNQDQTDELGRYEMIGLSPGPQCLLAAHADPPRKGEETPSVLQEGQETPPVRLVVPDKIDVRGRIRPRLGFAAGARVVGWPAGATGQAVGFSDLTDEDGDFRLSLSPAARKFDFVVLAPGSALRMLRAEVSRERLLEIPVDTPGGTLILDLGDQTPENAGPLDGPPRKKTPCDPLRKIESLTAMQILRHWADLQGTPQTPGLLVVPNVEPGPYTLCAAGSTPSLRRREPPAGDARCVDGILEAEGELTLKLPRVPPR